MDSRLGISGRIAGFFQSAQITPLLALVALLLGAFAVLVTPREEEPQINVTMANVLIPFPGPSLRKKMYRTNGSRTRRLTYCGLTTKTLLVPKSTRYGPNKLWVP